MLFKRLTSLLTAFLMIMMLMPASAQDEGTDIVVRSAPLIKSDDVQNGMVRVYLSSMGSVTSLDVTIVGSYSVSGATSMALYDGQTVHISFDTSTGQITMTVNGVSYEMGMEMSLRRHQATGQSAVKIAQANRPGNIYPGDLQLLASTSGSGYKLYPIVHVYIEYYLYGVVPYEMSSSWPAEALKAQAVAARTYTLNRMNGRSGYNYDLVDTSSDQVYNGHAGTETNATRAVDATRGIVIMNNGKLSGTYYTASNGGQTEAVANAWGSKEYPYLGVKDDPFDMANSNTIKRKLNVYSNFNHAEQNSTLKSLLTSKVQSLYGSGVSILTIDSITPHTPKYAAPSRLYTKMDFGVTLSSGFTAALSFNIFNELENPLSMSINSGKNELWWVERNGGDFIIRSARYGHGIGMSQRGAQQMSGMGYTYDQILGFYYEGCERVQYTFTHSILPPVGSGGGPVVSTESPAPIEPGTGCSARISLPGVAEALPLRYTPSQSAKVLITAPNGTSVDVLSSGSAWTLIQYGQINGYVPTANLVITGTPPSGTGDTATDITQWGTVTGNSSLNLRAGASYNDTVIGSIPGGGIVAIINYGDWSYVQYGQQTGYCRTSFLTLSDVYPGEVPNTGTSAMVSLPGSTGAAPLRSTPSTNGTILLYVDHGMQVIVHSNDGSWCRVTVSGVTGYMLTSALDFNATGTTPTEPPLGESEMYAIVASEASTLNLRSGPSTGYSVIAEIPKGTRIVVTDYGSDWCAIRWGNLTGYVMTKYLSFDVEDGGEEETPTPEQTHVPSGALAMIITNANLYTSASTGSSIQLVIPSGQTVSVLAYGSTWTQISYANLTGYVLTSTLELYQDMQTPTPTSEETETPTPTPSATPTASPTESPTAEPEPTYEPINTQATLILNAQFRAEPNTGSAVLATIPVGSTVTVTLRGSSWCQVVYEGMTGWVLTTYLNFHESGPTPTATPEETSAPEVSEVVTETAKPTVEPVVAWISMSVTNVNLRKTASTEAEILMVIPAGESVTVLETGNTWSRVRYSDATGYIFTSNLTYAEPYSTLGIRYINTEVDPLALRAEPSTSGRLLTRIDRGAAITLLAELGDWSFVQHGQMQGYCASRYLSTVKPERHPVDETRLLDYTLTEVVGWTGIVSTQNGSSIFARQWCSLEAPEVMEVTCDTRVTVLEKGDIWCLIAMEGNEGYCLTSQLQLIAPQD